MVLVGCCCVACLAFLVLLFDCFVADCGVYVTLVAVALVDLRGWFVTAFGLGV